MENPFVGKKFSSPNIPWQHAPKKSLAFSGPNRNPTTKPTLKRPKAEEHPLATCTKVLVGVGVGALRGTRQAELGHQELEGQGVQQDVPEKGHHAAHDPASRRTTRQTSHCFFVFSSPVGRCL